METAFAEFVAFGVDGVSMERVAVAAKVSKRTLYGRFKSKNGLVLATTNHGLAKLAKPIADGEPQGSVRKKILYVTRCILDVSLTEYVLGLETLIEWIVDNGLHKDADASPLGYDAGVKMLEAILTEVVEDPEERAFMARHVYDALVTIPRMRILRLGDLSDTPECKGRYAERTLSLLSHGIPFLAE
nr:TetR/AcrR family transcriptional regulator [Sphingobium sp. DC-2]